MTKHCRLQLTAGAVDGGGRGRGMRGEGAVGFERRQRVDGGSAHAARSGRAGRTDDR